MGASVFGLTDKVAIVTGGGRGIGRAIALEFARAGADVVVVSRTMSELEDAAGEIRKLGRRSLAVVTDVSNPEDVDNLVKRTVDEFGRIDILVNNASAQILGGSAQRPLAEDMTPEEWDFAFSVDMKGAFLCSKAAGKVMMAQNKGKIINISSTMSVDRPLPRHIHYGSAKAGLNQFTKLLAVEWAKYKINVNCIVSGIILTKKAREGLEKLGAMDKIAKTCALGRAGTPEEIAYGAIFLASDASDFVDGALLVIDGGPVSMW